MCGQEYPDQQAYEKALAEKCPSLPREVKEQLDLNNDLNRTYLTDVREGIEDCRAICMSAMVTAPFLAQKTLPTGNFFTDGFEN